MESLVTELVWLVTNYQAWVVGVLLFGDPHIWYRRYSFFEILALCKDAGTAPATRRKNFLVSEFLMQHGCRGLSVVLAGGSIRRSTPPPLVTC